MENYDCEVYSIELAEYWMQQLRACLEMVKEKAKSDPKGARCLLGPAADLANELMATHATVEVLTEQIQSPVETPSLFQ